MKIAIVGAGYVGLSLAILLSQNHEVVVLDIVESKVHSINNKCSPLVDREIEHYLKTKSLNLTATLDQETAYSNASYVIIATPTDYDDTNKCFDTSMIEHTVCEAIRISPHANIVIKSTVQIGFTEYLIEKTGHPNILFSPEFLREGKALYDNLYPSRIVVGYDQENLQNAALNFADLLKKSALTSNVEIILTNSKEAESIKLFSNTYLALRVAFFNELDSFAQTKGLNTKLIIDGIGLDPRIGNHYNNPSFGYGGYCLPKDTKQLLAQYENIPNDIIKAIVNANIARKKFVAEEIIKKECDVVGIYRLSMKSGSDNFRQSSIIDIISILKESNQKMLIFEPNLSATEFLGCEVISDFYKFIETVSVILANRFDESLNICKEKIYTRDLFLRD